MGGHAVVLIDIAPNYLRFLNSWGAQWADKGFFKVAKADVLNLKFIDVFWTLDDLTATEKSAYDSKRNKSA
jgi:hypothetical protein